MPIDILKTLLQVDASIAQLATNVLELGPKNRSAVAAKEHVQCKIEAPISLLFSHPDSVLSVCSRTLTPDLS
ncbi:uncharacterized protein ACHE_11840A [Aspergillus chevalieri]|uniref:Uncharacterized protein n=1 Tax=Aspergillus chevalieri TaxID=182096 RepID=A0A7R7ZJK1_ASPCH|nr:uncharacterized protein ACHE_11840A [Aspergillus chevalieri]BCR84438.1 hypothetical protein ACHE_11840A [Aspergillus chevalieri]